MRFASVRDFRTSVSSVLSIANENNDTVVVTLRGKPVALFVPIDESQFDTMTQAIKSARLRVSVNTLRREASRAGSSKLTPTDIDREIKAVRRSHKRA